MAVNCRFITLLSLTLLWGLPTAFAKQKSLINLKSEVVLSAAEREFVAALPPLKVAAYPTASPYAWYNNQTGSYSGLSVDIFEFVAERIGLNYQFVVQPHISLENDLNQVKTGGIDVYMPTSASPSRAALGLFTKSYMQDYYAVIAQKTAQLNIQTPQQLSKLRVGYINSASVANYLKKIIPAENLHEYTNTQIFEALRKKEIDVAIYLQRVFGEELYRHEFFDLEDVYTLEGYPRNYVFLFSQSAQHQQLVNIFDRYIPQLYLTKAMRYHSNGKRQLVDKYVESKVISRKVTIAMLVVSVLALLLVVLYVRRKNTLHRLGEEVSQLIEQKKELQEKNQQLASLTRVDALTGLANRRHFNEVLQQEFKQHIRSKNQLSLLLIDIDYFKRVNDSYGHTVGDHYLQQVAATIASNLARPIDLAVRLGGEEFVCVLPSTDFNGAMLIAENIRRAIENLALPNKTDYGRLTVSVGVSSTEGVQGTFEDLVASSDRYLYQAKRNGRNQICGRDIGVAPQQYIT